MGHVHQRVKLSAEKTATVRMLVDTGATFSVIPESLARAVGIKRLRRSVAITLADGRRVKLDAGTAIFRIGKREAPATILVGGVIEPILGVETLEALGLTVDSRRRRLAPSRNYAVRLGGLPITPHRALVHELLDPVQESFATLGVHLARLIAEERVDVGIAAVGANPAGDHEGLDPCRRVAGGATANAHEVL